MNLIIQMAGKRSGERRGGQKERASAEVKRGDSSPIHIVRKDSQGTKKDRSFMSLVCGQEGWGRPGGEEGLWTE